MHALAPLAALAALMLQPAPVIDALTGAALPSASAICPYTGLPAVPVAPPPALKLDFETGTGNLQASGGASLTVLREEGPRGAFARIDCTANIPIGSGDAPGVVLIDPPKPTACLGFQLRSKSAQSLAIIALETDESAYMTVCSLPAGRWQAVAIDLGDMVAAPDTAVDENGKLDLDQIAGVIVCDPRGFDAATRDQSDLVLDIDDLFVRDAAVRSKPLVSGNGVQLGDFAISGLGWLSMGLGAVDIVEDEAEPGTFVARLTCEQPEQLHALVAVVPTFGFRGRWLSVEVWVRAQYPCTLAAFATEGVGGDYWASQPVAGTGEWELLVFRADTFQPSGDKPDTVNGRLDTDLVQGIGVAIMPTEPGSGAWSNVVDVRRVVVAPAEAAAEGGDPFR